MDSWDDRVKENCKYKIDKLQEIKQKSITEWLNSETGKMKVKNWSTRLIFKNKYAKCAWEKLYFKLIENWKPYEKWPSFLWWLNNLLPKWIFGYETEAPVHALLEGCQQQCSCDIDHMDEPTYQLKLTALVQCV